MDTVGDDNELTRTTEPLNPIKKVGQYVLGAEISRGGMGIVYQGMDEDLKRALAIKMLPKEYFKSKKDVDRFKLEAQIVAKLDHHNIMRVYAYIPADETVWIAMELLKGRILTDHIKEKKKIPPEEAIDILQQLIDALAYAHKKGVIHRDIKPGNVMIGPDGEVKLMDFGIARDEESDMHLTQEGAILGTPKYMSPEQFSGQKVDHRSDIYSLGVMAYEMVAGQSLFVAKNLASIAYKHIHEAPTPIRKLVPGIPAELDDFIMKSLAKKPADRIQNFSGYRLKEIDGVSKKKVLVLKGIMSLLALGLLFMGFSYFRKVQDSRRFEKAETIYIEALEALLEDNQDEFEKKVKKAIETHPASESFFQSKATEDLRKKDAEKTFHEGLQALKDGDEKLFQKKLEEAIALSPEQEDYFHKASANVLENYKIVKARQLTNKATDSIFNEDIKTAITQLEQALEYNPLYYDALQMLADDIYFGDNNEKYAEFQERALAIKPIDPKRWHNLALAYSSMGNKKKMKETAERGLKFCPNAVELENLLKAF